MMKIIQELPEIFHEFGEQRRNSFLEIKQYKDKGIPVVGMYCAYFPPELAIAAGAVPVALCSFADETIPAAERVMPKSMCPLVKSSYGFAIEDKCPLFHFADLVIGETTCDGKKKMYEMMMEFKPVHVMELPNTQSERGYAFWKEEVLRAKEYLEEFFHVEITEKMIRDAVHLNNRIRTSLKSLCEVMKLDPAPVSGEDIQKMVLGSKYRFDFQTTPELVAGVRDKILEEYAHGKMLEKRVRIMVTGCPVGGDTLKVIRSIEANGGVVVATENCSGVRALSTMVEEDTDDIYGAIARKYLSTGCSIMTPNDNRIELLSEIIDEYHVDGVVEVILTGCHATGAESYYISRFVNEEKNLPYIAIDTDYSNADFERISTRLAAFIEMIQAEGLEREQIDLNCCYKIILSGINARKTKQEILEEIWEYTRIPVGEYDKQGQLVAGGGLSRGNLGKAEKVIEKECLDGQRKFVAYVMPGVSEKIVGQLLDILYKNDNMRKQSHESRKSECPDFLWIIATEEKDLESIRSLLEQDTKFQGKTDLPEGNKMFISCMQGEEDRKRLIYICRECTEDFVGQILIGNGFKAVSYKEENCRLQERVMQLALEKREWEKVLLTENYYREIAIDYMSEEMKKESVYIKELDILHKGELEKGKELYDTLYWYLRMKRNVALTAAKMKLHRNTLLPRIAKLNEIMEVDAMSGTDCERSLLVMEVEQRQSDKKK